MASTYLSRTNSSAGNRTKWTLSVWLKRSKLGAENPIFTCIPSANFETFCGFASDDRLVFKQKNDGSLDLNAENEILNSVKLINRYIDEIETETGISSKNFILVGFSQGTMMVLETLLSREKKISAVVGLSLIHI